MGDTILQYTGPQQAQERALGGGSCGHFILTHCPSEFSPERRDFASVRNPNKIQTLKVCVLGLAQRQVKYMAAVKQPFQNHRWPECSEWKQLTFSVMSYSGRKALLFEWASPPGCRANDFIILLSGTFSSENVCVYREIHLHCLSAPLWGSII